MYNSDTRRVSWALRYNWFTNPTEVLVVLRIVADKGLNDHIAVMFIDTFSTVSSLRVDVRLATSILGELFLSSGTGTSICRIQDRDRNRARDCKFFVKF